MAIESIPGVRTATRRSGLARIRFRRWDAVVSTLSVQDQSTLRLVVCVEAPPHWQPHGSDLDSVIAVARGRIPVEDCVRQLRGQWQASRGESAPLVTGATVSMAASAGMAVRAQWLLERARDAKSVLVDRGLRTQVAGSTNDWIKRIASETLRKRGPGGGSGALGQFHGHLFAHLDTKSHAAGTRMVQHRLSSAGVVRAAKRIDTPATLRLPKDQASAAAIRLSRTRVAGRMRIEASGVTTSVVKRRGQSGLRQLSSHGGSAVSSVHRFGRSAGISAVTAAVIGAATDARKLYRREMSTHEFAALRGMDAAEHAASHLAGIAAASGVVVGAGMVAGSTTGMVAASAAAVAGGVGVAASAVPVAVTVATGFAVSRAVRPLRRRAQAWAAERAQARVLARVAEAGPDALAPAPDVAALTAPAH